MIQAADGLKEEEEERERVGESSEEEDTGGPALFMSLQEVRLDWVRGRV